MRTPLNGIIGVNQLLLETTLDDEQQELVGLTKTSADSLLSLINDILDLTRVESGKLELEYFDFDFRSTMEDAIDSIIMAASSKGIQLICAIHPTIPRSCRGDANRLKQVVLNLLSNAIKFTQSGEVEVCAELESETATHHVLKISVRDTGIGIPQEAQSKLFNRFTQVDSSTTRNYGGSGLGLAISKQLVELMSGTMGVSSMPGRGSTFWLTVVLERAETLCKEVRQLPSDMCPVLVVSKNISTRNTLACCLQAWGADVSAAADEKEAQIYLNAHQTGTTIISLTLPEYNLTVMGPIMDFLVASITDVRFWIILCPINFVGKVRELVADVANSFATEGKMLAAHVARNVVVTASPVRQGVLYDCLTQLSSSGVYRKGVEDYDETGKLRPGRKIRSDNEPTTFWNPCLKLDDRVERLNSPGVSDSVGSAVSDLESEALPFKVLVAEDSLANQLALKRMLEKLGAVVTVVADGSEAVDLLVTRGVRYNLALFDLQMPILGGVEAMHYVRDVQIDMPIIAISASVEDAQLQRLIEEGFSMVMIKPMKISTCRDILVKYGHVLPTSLDTGAYLNPATPPPISFSGSSDYLSKLADEDVSALREPSSALRERGVGHVYPPGGNQSTTCIVLLVEDNETSQRIAQRILERDGIVVHVATTGVEAVERAQQTPYDAVLMDCDLPLKDGWQATREIRKWEVACGGHGGKRVPIIAVTANAMRGDRERCLEEGMDDYLSKPVQRVSLLQTAGHVPTRNTHSYSYRYVHPPAKRTTHTCTRTSVIFLLTRPANPTKINNNEMKKMIFGL